jgi:PAS domain S-box-containing protein
MKIRLSDRARPVSFGINTDSVGIKPFVLGGNRDRMSQGALTLDDPGIYGQFEAAERRWIQALYELPLPVVVADESSEIVLFNPAMQELMALDPRRIPELEPWEIFRTYETHGTKTTMAERTREAGEPIRGIETELLDHEDTEHDVVISSTPMYDDGGEITGTVTAMRDVTELREKERELTTTHEQVADQLGEIVERLEEITQRVATNATEIEDDAVEQDSKLQDALSEIESVSASMEQIAATTDQITDTVDGARELATDGQRAGEQAGDAAEGMLDASEQLTETITELADRMDDIDEITEVIAEIADQTNMLALNANIEAARADQGGEGFAVVADEVKSLAHETQEYTDEISSEVQEIQNSSRTAVSEVEQA